MSPKCGEFSAFRYTIGTFAFRAQPQSVNVTADPSFRIPGQCTTVISILVLKLIQQHEGVELFVVDTMTCHIWKGGCTVSVGKYRDRGSTRGGRPSIHAFHTFHFPVVHAHLTVIHRPHLAVVH